MNFLSDRAFANQDHAKTAFLEIAASRPPTILFDAISQLVSRWKNMVI